ncbi:MAG: hypothetical protein QOF70_3257, partial [Acetobacteraceae bacterium]|nr:hypothetical protein [Acetobacteraceae bacterium]
AERLSGLGLTAMADAFLEMRNQSAADDLSREDWLGLLIDREVTARDSKRLGQRLTQAQLRQNAVIEDADLRTRAVSIAACSRCSRRVAGSATVSMC